MRHAVVHVGLPRTGTTTLQRILSRLRPELLRAGVLYPELTPRSAAAPHLSHQHLGEALDGRRPVHEKAELLQDLERQLATTDAEIVLLSYEGLCLMPRGRAVPQTLAALFGRHGFTASALATIKPQADYLNSTYTWRMQFLREQRRFADYVSAEIGGRHLDLTQLLAPWRTAFGGRLTVVPTRDPRSDQPLPMRVLAEIGILPRIAGLITAGDTTLVENRSPGPFTVEAARQLREGGAHLALGRTAREATRFVEDAARAAGLDAAGFNGLDATLRSAIEARWSPMNDSFARLAWDAPWEDRVASGPGRAPNEVARHPDDPESARHVAALVAATCGRFGVRLRAGPGIGVRTVFSAAFSTASSRVGRWLGR